MASSSYVSRSAYARSPVPAHPPHHLGTPPENDYLAGASSAFAPRSLHYSPSLQAHRQNSAPASSPRLYSPGHGTERPNQSPSPPHMAQDEPSSIKCSSCSAWVPLEALGLQQVASPPANASSPLALASPASTGQGATGPSRLPFFDRYQQLVDTAESAVDSMAGVGSARSPRLAPGGSAHPTQPPPPRLARSATAPTFPTSVSAPTLGATSPAPYYPQTQQRRRPDAAAGADYGLGPVTGLRASPSVREFGRYRQPSSGPSHSASAEQTGPSQRQSPRPSAPPPVEILNSRIRSRPTVHPDPVQSELARADSQVSASSAASSARLPYDRSPNGSLPHSRSTPARLASETGTSGSGKRGAASARQGLDACLEDLRLVAHANEVDGPEDEDEVEGELGARGHVRYGDRSTGLLDGFTPEDLLSTPRQSPGRNQVDAHERAAFRPPASSSSTTRALASSQPLTAGAATTTTEPLACSACHAPLPASSTPKRTSSGPPFCRSCYADRFLPKCRKCGQPIEGGAVTSRDGKILGKYHPRCFRCFACEADFPAGDFYVFDGKPYCQQDYHALNGSLCADQRCGKPIEGSCVSLVGEERGNGGRYHPACFKCSDPACLVPLLSHHFVVDRLPYCDVHAAGPVRRRPQAGAGAREGAEARAKKRQTIITRA